MKSVQGGIMADAAASFTGGLMGEMGQASYAANIGLSAQLEATFDELNLELNLYYQSHSPSKITLNDSISFN